MSSMPIITIVGGGSVQWSPTIVTDLLHRPELHGATIVLHDLDDAAANLIAQYTRAAASALDVAITVRVEPDLERALDPATDVLITISTGGLDAMAHDLSIPEQYGIFHTVGDSCGPGGWSRLVRNYPIFTGLATAIHRWAPEAWILNYSNPMTTLTGILARRLDNPVIGLCHGLFDNIDVLSRIYDLAPGDLDLSYGGLNHFFWTTSGTANGQDLLADLRSRIEHGTTLTDLDEAAPGAQPAGPFRSARELATELFRLTGVLPFFEDRHTSEFVSWAITDPQAMAALRLVRTTIEQRRTNQVTWTREVETALREGIPADRLEASRESAAAIVAAHHGGPSLVDVGNLPNRGQVAQFPTGLVVETPVRTGPDGFTPVSAPPLPASVMGLLAAPAAVYEMSLDACEAGDRTSAIRALRLDPSTGHLSTERLTELATALLTANEAFGPTPFQPTRAFGH